MCTSDLIWKIHFTKCWVHWSCSYVHSTTPSPRRSDEKRVSRTFHMTNCYAAAAVVFILLLLFSYNPEPSRRVARHPGDARHANRFFLLFKTRKISNYPASAAYLHEIPRYNNEIIIPISYNLSQSCNLYIYKVSRKIIVPLKYTRF